MKRNEIRILFVGIALMVTFVIWTVLIQVVDVQPVGQNGTDIGLASFNSWVHRLLGVHMTMYVITDWLGLVPIFVCMIFAGLGVFQLVKRRSLFKVDYDILILGGYYIIVIFGYLVFEMIPINYRPVLIEGRIEASYPSSTTLLVLCVMPTLAEQTNRRTRDEVFKRVVQVFVICFSAFMVVGRFVSGVHWFSDIVGAILLSAGLFNIYQAVVLFCFKESRRGGPFYGIS